MSSDLQWMILRRSSSFLVSSPNVYKGFTKEPNNLKGLNSFRYNGLIHKKTIGIVPASDGKGVVMITKKKSGSNKPSKSFNKTTLKRDGRRTLKAIKQFVTKNRYRKDLKMAALRRASAILKSQRPVLAKRLPRKKQ